MMNSLVPDKPVSAILNQAAEEDNDDGPKKQTKEEWKKAKELEEARKAGTEPAEVDEEGKDINPHIPQYISRVPWYFGSDRPTLKHQRVLNQKATTEIPLDFISKKGVIEGKTATRYRKGACENCGSMTHSKKDCLERPRKVGAKFTGTDIAPDEYVQQYGNLSFDSKRDKWIGYDVSQHKKVWEEYAKVEEAKRQLKAQKLQQDLQNAETAEQAKEIKQKLRVVEEEVERVVSDEEEEKYAEGAAMPGTKFETKERITVRNLRIREDTAKYLRNLDPNSAFYDPKTRSMRENPYAPLGKGPQDVDYAGDNFVRAAGDSLAHSTTQLFAWEMVDKGADVHLQAEPTKLEQLKREYREKKEEMKSGSKDSIIDKYGGKEHLDAPPKELLLAQSEHYIEYSRTGAVVKGQEKVIAKSKYEEDVYINNHTSVWGSYWSDHHWGYACCHSLIKQSYCTGSTGKLALDQSDQVTMTKNSIPEEDEEEGSDVKERKKKKKKKHKKQKEKAKRKHKSSSSSSDSEIEEGELNRKKLKRALKAEEEQRKAAEMMMDERNKPYNSLKEVQAPTEEEMEAYRLKQMRSDDPMAHLL